MRPVLSESGVRLLDLGACVTIALWLAIAPHAAAWYRSGSTEYLADNDDILYLSVARIIYHGENRLRDPFASRNAGVPTLYSDALFVPPSIIARGLDLGPLKIPLVWRSCGAIVMAGALYWLFNRLFEGLACRRTGVLVCTILCLTDGGVIDGRSLASNLLLATQYWLASPLELARGIGQYRVVTPLLNIAVPILLAGCLLPKVLSTRIGLIGAVLLLTLCVWTYFYYWTAAVVAGVGQVATSLSLAFFASGERRDELASHTKRLIVVMTMGLLLGSPSIYKNLQMSRDDAIRPVLDRLERGRIVTADEPIRTAHLNSIWTWAKLALGAAAVFAFRLPQLAILWWMCAAGFILQNSAIFTMREYENFHWGGYVVAPFGEILLLAAAVLGADRIGRDRACLSALGSVAVVITGIALIWRPYEAFAASEPRRHAETLIQFSPLRDRLAALGADDVLAGPPETSIAVLFGGAAILYQVPYTAHGSVIPDEEVHERAALNSWILGRTREMLTDDALHERFPAGRVDRPAWAPEYVAAAQSAIYDRLESRDGAPLLEKYRPNFLLQRDDQPRPKPHGRWRLVQQAPPWRLWEMVH